MNIVVLSLHIKQRKTVVESGIGQKRVSFESNQANTHARVRARALARDNHHRHKEENKLVRCVPATQQYVDKNKNRSRRIKKKLKQAISS